MGAESSVLEGCEWGDEIQSNNMDWTLKNATLKDGRHVTIFQSKKAEGNYFDMLHQLAKKLKTLRHPSLLRFVGSGRSPDGFCLVTERVIPLSVVLDHLPAAEICAGLFDIINVLTFLHSKVGVSHNNICLGSLFVAQDGGWRLGELQHSCFFKDLTPEYLGKCQAFRNQAALAPEEKKNMVAVQADFEHACDMYAFGVLTEHFMDSLCELDDFGKSFEQLISACLSPNPAERPKAQVIRNDKLFQNEFVQILSFLQNVALKNAEEKTEFFRGLLPRLLALPERLIGRRLTAPLLSRFVLMDSTAVTCVVPNLLKPKEDIHCSHPVKSGITPLLSTDIFRAYVIPELEHIFLVRDTHIRLVLLKHFSLYAHLFGADTLRQVIFPQVLLGIRDTSDSIVAASLRVLADLVLLLGGDTVVGGQRVTMFFQGMPKFPIGANVENAKRPLTVSDALQPLQMASLTHHKSLLHDLTSHSIGTEDKTGTPLFRIEHEEAHLKWQELKCQLKLQQLEADLQNEKNLRNVEKDNEVEGMRQKRNTVNEALTDLSDNTSVADKGDWSDWDDMEKSSHNAQRNTVQEKTESAIILKEKVQTSPDPYRAGSPVSPAQSDVVSHVRSVMAYPVSSNIILPQEREQANMDVVMSPNSAEMLWSTLDVIKGEMLPTATRFAQSTDKQLSSGKGLKLTSKHQKPFATGTKSSQTKKFSHIDDLGYGYDIKSIELTVVKEEVDFFSDMTPSIQTSGINIRSLATSDEMEVKHVSEGKTIAEQVSHLFAVADTSVGDQTEGWGDADWSNSAVDDY